MGCCEAKQVEIRVKKMTLDDIDDKPYVDGVPAINQVCDFLWDLKDRWTIVRKPLQDA